MNMLQKTLLVVHGHGDIVVPSHITDRVMKYYITLFHNAAYTLSDQWCINKVIFVIHRRA